MIPNLTCLDGNQLTIVLNFFSSNLYLSQTKFAKVMFSQVFVCPWGGSVSGVGGGLGRPQSPNRIIRDTINERAVRILLECILVSLWIQTSKLKTDLPDQEV